MSSESKTNVYITVDTEVWSDDWRQPTVGFQESFNSYIYGRTRSGDHGLPFMLKVLRDNGLRAVFFVEPLFTLQLGMEPLREIVGVLKEGDQHIELHLHTEWLAPRNENTPISTEHSNPQHMKYFSYQDQEVLVKTAKARLMDAGVESINAFRAGNFGADNNTLKALAANGIPVDSSYNGATDACGIEVAKPWNQATIMNGVIEVPQTIFKDGLNRSRQASILGCSSGEMRSLLRQANGLGWQDFVVLTHPFEFLNNAMTRANSVAKRRFIKLCEFIASQDNFATAGFNKSTLNPSAEIAAPLRTNLPNTLLRYAEQVQSRLQ